ncbi:GLUG motif-containing protein [Virgibacillus sp. W0430]|uniref:GLUG motif-containing protein n=1 Tax=Virgibacillus sp. W0430 TaxID=3391580 RepID=UPI003F474C30
MNNKTFRIRLSKNVLILICTIFLIGSLLPSLQVISYAQTEGDVNEGDQQEDTQEMMDEEEGATTPDEDESDTGQSGEMESPIDSDQGEGEPTEAETEQAGETDESLEDGSNLDDEKAAEQETASSNSETTEELESPTNRGVTTFSQQPFSTSTAPSSTSITEIHTVEDLNNIRNNLSGHYVLMNDIDLSTVNGNGYWTPIGSYASNPFMGTLDGNGHTIQNIKINAYGVDYLGLFAYTSSAEIRDLTLENVDVSGRSYIGALIGAGIGTTIDNVAVVSADITGDNYIGGLVGEYTNQSTILNSSTSGMVYSTGSSGRIGGLAGAVQGSSIINSASTSTVEGKSFVGGLIGHAISTVTIKNSFATGKATGTNRVGGLIGYFRESTIESSYATGEVSGTSHVGGLVGYQEKGTIKESYATGYVSSTNSVGGLIGSTYQGSVLNSYATGTVEGSNINIGGLIGQVNSTNIENSYAAGSIVEGVNYSGGLIGDLSGDATLLITNSYYDKEATGQTDEGKGVGKTTAEMQDASTYVNWDFSSIWGIHPSQYPHLQFNAPAPPITPTPDGTIYVKEGESGHGVSWSDAFGTLQEALDIATAGDEIWMAEGTYVPTQGLDTNDKRTNTFQMKNGVTIYGGFPATGNPTLSERDPKMYETILSGDLDRNDDGTLASKQDNAYHVIYNNDASVNQTAVLDGVTITGGFANGDDLTNQQGAGMYNANASPTIQNVVFLENAATYSGGGMYNNNSNVVVIESRFLNNTATDFGGGMHNDNGSPILHYVTFDFNWANTGGGIYNIGNRSDITIKNVEFNSNMAQNGAGLTVADESKATLINTLMLFNNTMQDEFGTPGGQGSALYIANGGQVKLINATVTRNGSEVGSVIYMSDSEGAALDIQNTIIWGNLSPVLEFEGIYGTVNSTHSIIEGSGGSDSWDDAFGKDRGNNLDVDPLFVESGDHPVSLEAHSPAINGGNNDFVPGDIDEDFARNARIHHHIVDIGAYEYVGDQLRTISAVETFDPIHVSYGTLQSELMLPEKVKVTLDDNTTLMVDVNWSEGSPAFDPEQPGEYTFTGKLASDDQYVNVDDIQAIITVIVEAEEQEQGNENEENSNVSDEKEATNDETEQDEDPLVDEVDQQTETEMKESNSEQVTDEESDMLPKTATAYFTILLIGVVITFIGIMIYVLQRKKSVQ